MAIFYVLLDYIWNWMLLRTIHLDVLSSCDVCCYTTETYNESLLIRYHFFNMIVSHSNYFSEIKIERVITPRYGYFLCIIGLYLELDVTSDNTYLWNGDLYLDVLSSCDVCCYTTETYNESLLIRYHFFNMILITNVNVIVENISFVNDLFFEK
jgi:hypothetical protein